MEDNLKFQHQSPLRNCRTKENESLGKKKRIESVKQVREHILQNPLFITLFSECLQN